MKIGVNILENKLQIFRNSEFGEVRVVEINNEPWFVGKDVAENLGYAKARNAISAHVDSEDKKEAPIQGDLGGVQQMTVVNESGLYSLILRSKLESAKKFKKWVTSEVLPSIRKHRAYMTDNLVEQIYEDPQTMIDLLIKLKEEKENRIKAERKNAILMHTNKTYTATEIAKELGFKSATALNKDLCDKGIQYKVNNTYVLYSDYASLGYVSIKQQILDSGKEVYNRHFTQEGRDFILNLYKQDKAN